MKIAVVMYRIMDLGGIINHTEDMIYGLKRQGHEVDLLQLIYSDKDQKDRGGSRLGVWGRSESGHLYNQAKGWIFPASHRIPYQGRQLKKAQERLETYDLVIWTTPVANKNSENRGNWEWTSLYDLKNPKQIAIIHDGGACDRYPYMMAIEDKLTAALCVHHSAIGGSTFLKVPRFHVLNPFRQVNREKVPFEVRRPGFVSLQTFKALKHVDDLVRAIAYMPKKSENEYRDIYGKGIEYQYMTSVDKCKPHYFHGSDTPFAGERIWEVAEENGMVHHDYIERDAVDILLQSARVLVDPSWSKRLGSRGGFYGRVFVEAAINGAVPVGRILGIGTEVFHPGEHYVSIPMDADPQTYGEIVLYAGKESEEGKRIRDNLQELVQRYDAERIARDILEIAFGSSELPQLYHDPHEAELLYEKANSILFIHFGI